MISTNGVKWLWGWKCFFICSLTCIFLVLTYSGADAQSSFQEGQNWFQKRSVKADSFRTETQNIDKAIQAFEESIKVHFRIKESVIYLLQAYYFKGMYTNIDNGQRKQAFDNARQWGEKMVREYPDAVAIKYWYALNLRQWDKMHNLWQTTIDRTDKKLRDMGRNIIELDSTYQGGGGYRFLAKIHFETPSIWLIKGWPSNDEALKFIRMAVKIAPDVPVNRLFYAQMLIHFGRKAEAKTQLLHLQDMNPRPSHLVEDRFNKHRAEMLLQKHFPGKQE